MLGRRCPRGRPYDLTVLLGRAKECATLAGLVDEIRSGHSRVLVVRGEAGVGKTALLEYAMTLGADATLVRAVGVESEMELAYASLHQLCVPLLDHVAALPAPQRHALEVVFGVAAGAAPDRLLVGLAVLSLLCEVSLERPLLCVVDDAQWLDRSSALTLAFVARRLLAEPVGLVFGVRDGADAFRRLPELEVGGLRNGDARALLTSAVRFRLDAQVVDRVVAETRGNPLALLELPRGLSAAELAGFGTGGLWASPNGIEDSFRRRIAALPDDTRRLLGIAAAEPLGEPALVWRAAALQGVGPDAAAPAAEAGLCELGARVQFRHPLVRSAAYRAVTADERRQAHAALAEATDVESDPDRRAWHRASACAGPDDAVADELERSAARARARGGQSAAAAFLERAADLTLDPGRRAQRALAAAEAMHLAGSAEDALRLATAAERGPVDELRRVRVDLLRGHVALMQRRGVDALPPLLSGARRVEALNPGLAREAYRDAFQAALFAGRLAPGDWLAEVAAAIRTATPSADPPSPADELLDAGALLVDAGWAAGARPVLRALDRVLPVLDELELPWVAFAGRMAGWVWDLATLDAVTGRMLERVREAGVLALLPMAAILRSGREIAAGDLAAAAALTAEQEAVQEAIGGERSSGSGVHLAGMHGSAAEVRVLDETLAAAATARGDGAWLTALHLSTALLCNGLGRYTDALTAAQHAVAYPGEKLTFHWGLSELVEAAVRCGRRETAAEAHARLAEGAGACATDWAGGVEARARALVDGSPAAEEQYRLAIDRFGRVRLRTELARTQLLFGEWLRREGRRADAREHLRAAHETFAAIGMEAFAQRARRELAATGEHVRRRSTDARDDLTPQERQIAVLARDGLSNPDIAARVFLSPRTVEWHLRKVFMKLDVRSRRELAGVLPGSESDAAPT
jgi:DNA-binding CsgD family transcriptional regulator